MIFSPQIILQWELDLAKYNICGDNFWQREISDILQIITIINSREKSNILQKIDNEIDNLQNLLIRRKKERSFLDKKKPNYNGLNNYHNALISSEINRLKNLKSDIDGNE